MCLAPLTFARPLLNTLLAHRYSKCGSRVNRHDFVLCAVDQEGRRDISAISELHKRRDGGEEVRRRTRSTRVLCTRGGCRSGGETDHYLL